MNAAAYVIRPAERRDVATIRHLIHDLAVYEKLAHEMTATDALLEAHLFGPMPAAEVLIAEVGGEPAGFALFFTNFSTFLGKPGIYLEDLFVRPEHRGAGLGKALLQTLARLVVTCDGGRLDWSVLDWNEPSIDFYRRQGAVAMDGWTGFRLTGQALLAFAGTDNL